MLKNKVILLLVVYLIPFVLFAQTSSYDMVSQMGRGINLGNVFSAPVEGNWAAAVEEQYFIDIGIPEDYQKAQDDFKTFEY